MTTLTYTCDHCSHARAWTIEGQAALIGNWKAAARAELALAGWLVDDHGVVCSGCLKVLFQPFLKAVS